MAEPLTPERIELIEDAAMVRIAEAHGWDKCVRVGCITLIDKTRNRDGFCEFHRPKGDARRGWAEIITDEPERITS